MADNTLKVRLQSAYKSSADWNTLNPVLKNGEVGYVSSPASMYGWYKIGNGTSTWKQLPYSTYRPLNNGDFDTINVTDETAGDLIVTGAARFLNTIQGTATSAVNAGTASSASNAAKTTGTLTIKEALGTPSTPSVTFNGSANATATITVPSHTSHLTNNSGFITSGATVAEAKKTSGTLTITQNGTSKGTFNGSANTTVALTDTVYTHPTDGKAGTFGSSTNQTPAFGGNAIVPWFTTNSAGHVTSAGTANLKIPSTSGLATTAYVNERVANAVHFKGGFDPSNADALKTPVKEIGDMYVATTTGTFYGLELESGDSIIFQSSVAANTNPTSANFIGVEKTVSVTNNNPTLAWNTVSTVGTVEGVNLTVKMPSNPNVDTKATQTATTAKSFLVGNAGSVTTTSGLNLSTAAYIDNTLLYSPQARHANTVYGVVSNFSTSSNKEVIIKTGIRWVGSTHMPIVYINGLNYATYSPVRLQLAFYIYNNKIGYTRAINAGGWEPSIFLFKYIIDSTEYVAIGLKGDNNFLHLSVDVQSEWNPGFTKTDPDKWSINFYNTTGNIPAADDGTTCCSVTYKANILNDIRNITVNGNALNINKNGSTSDLIVPYATKAAQDESGNNIKATYGSSIAVSGHTITLYNKNAASVASATLPNDNTDYRQGMNKDTTNKFYLTGTTSGSNSTATSIFSDSIYAQGTTATAPDIISTVVNTKIANALLTGAGTAARDAGSSANPRYFPALWKMNTGRTIKDGDIVTFKVPVAGHDYGVWLSADNGTHYYAIACNGTGRLTTHFPVNTYVSCIFETAGSVASVFASTGSNARITASGGCWRIINYYDSNSNDTGYYLRRIYTNLKAGSNKIFPYTIILQKPDGKWESLVKSSSTGVNKAANTNGFNLTPALLMYANATYDGNVGTYNIWSMHSGLIDHRYSFNTANNATNGTTGYKPIYLTGTIGSDGLFYLNTTKWWVQDLPAAGAGTEGTIYWYIGDAYDYYRMTFVDTQQIYIYSNGRIRKYSDFAQYASSATNAANAANANTVNNLTVQTAVPANAKFTDSAVILDGHYTPSSSGTFTPAAGGTTTDISTITLNIITGLQKDAKGHITGVVSGSIKATNTPNTDEKLKMTPASATKFYPAGGTSQTSAVSTAYFSSAVYIQGTSVVATNFVGTATTASYAANAAKVNNLTVQTAVPSGAIFTDTKNTAGSTNSDSKLFLIGATSQAANPQTYSDSEVYTTNGTLTTNKVQVGGTAVTLQYNSTTKSLDFVFA